MATHSNTLAWEIPRTEEPDGLQSMGVTELDMTEVTEHACMQTIQSRIHIYLWEFQVLIRWYLSSMRK